mgnify:FL=1
MSREPSAPPFFYQVFGLGVRSHIPCPELTPAPAGEDVSILCGEVPGSLANPILTVGPVEASQDEFLLNIPDLARFHVTGGNRIVLQTSPGASEASIRLFLFGSVFGALLYQRDMVPIHAAAIEHQGEAVLFAGPSGVGKSTLVGALSRRGKAVVADDLCAVDTRRAHRPTLLPGIHLLKLREDSVEKIGGRADTVCWVGNGKRRYEISTEGERSSPGPLPLARVYELTPHDRGDFGLIPLQGTAKMQSLLRNCYRPSLLRALGRRHLHFQQLALVAQNTPVLQARRPTTGFRLEELVEGILGDLQA